MRIGAALFNADHTRLGEEVRRAETAGIDFFHLDVFDGYAVADQAFPAHTLKALRPLTGLPFEVHLSAREPERFLPALAEAGADLVFLPAEHTPLVYETSYRVRELGMRAGICLALGMPLEVLGAALPLVDAALLLGRVTGEGSRGRDFNRIVLDRIRGARAMIDRLGLAVDLQAAGGLEMESCAEACLAGATSLPVGAALYREPDMRGVIAGLRERIASSIRTLPGPGPVESSP